MIRPLAPAAAVGLCLLALTACDPSSSPGPDGTATPSATATDGTTAPAPEGSEATKSPGGPLTSPGRTRNTVRPGAALAAAQHLTVKGRAPKTGYTRDRFGSAWADTDSNSCPTRVISMVRAVMELFSQRTWGVVGCA